MDAEREARRGRPWPSLVAAPAVLALCCALALLWLAGCGGGDSASLPSGAVAVVETVSPPAGVVTRDELDRGIEKYAALNNQGPPKPSDSIYPYFSERALGLILEEIWTRAEASRVGLTIPQRELESLQRQLVRSFGDPAAYRRHLADLKTSAAEARREFETHVLNAKLVEAETRKAVAGLPPGASEKARESQRDRAGSEFFASFHARWKARTRCSASVTMKDCSDGG